jgi:nucleolar MIF4G domain-containing protein 1
LSPEPDRPVFEFSSAEKAIDLSTDDDVDSGSEQAAEESGDWEGFVDDASTKKTQRTQERGSLSKVFRDKLAQDDAEIEDFERKLGIRKGRRTLPQAFKDDGLDEIIGEIGEGTASSEDEGAKRKSAYDNWLSFKRRKMEHSHDIQPISDRISQDKLDQARGDSEENAIQSKRLGSRTAKHDDPEDRSNLDTFSRGKGHDSDGMSADSEDYLVEGTESDNKKLASYEPSERENPYVAPTKGTIISKYVPPSRRHEEAEFGKQAQSHLQRKVRGLINRLTDANLISIVQSVEETYQSNARGEVTEILTDAILAQLRRPDSLPDQFFVLVGGFAAAIYKITGSSFGSHIVRQIVTEFNTYYGQVSEHDANQQALKKEPSNLLTFLTQLYVFEVVSCRIVFDYMEKLLNNLSELNVELLLRVCRMAGKLLRRDDPQALKHVSQVLSSAVSAVGYSNISARTKFMVETIQDLKNSKPKAKGMDSAIVSEHVLRMRKRLGELKSQSRRLEGLAPMGIGLKDIESVDKHGKWWLVGASVPTYRDTDEKAKAMSGELGRDHHNTMDEEDMDFVLPDYPNKARSQGLTTAAQIAIFTAIMSGLNYEHGYRQFAGLKLKRDEQLEITRVLVQCVGSEPEYNEYYALVGGQACANSRIKFAFQDRLWKLFRSLGEAMFGEEAEVDESADGERLKNERRLGNIALFYASLVLDGHLSIGILKALDLPELNEWSSLFVELFLMSVLRGCRGKEMDENRRVERIFAPARELPALAANLHWFLRRKVRKSKQVSDKDRRAIQRVGEKAQTAVHGLNVDGN